MKNGSINGYGTLTVGGKSQEVELKAQYKSENTGIDVKGVISLKMSDFGIEPPVAMFGSIKTGDRVSIAYQIFLKKEAD